MEGRIGSWERGFGGFGFGLGLRLGLDQKRFTNPSLA
jgi:hypothetical protein